MGSQLHCVKLERWQGPPHKNKVKQYEVVFFTVSLFIQFINLFRRKEISQ